MLSSFFLVSIWKNSFLRQLKKVHHCADIVSQTGSYMVPQGNKERFHRMSELLKLLTNSASHMWLNKHRAAARASHGKQVLFHWQTVYPINPTCFAFLSFPLRPILLLGWETAIFLLKEHTLGCLSSDMSSWELLQSPPLHFSCCNYIIQNLPFYTSNAFYILELLILLIVVLIQYKHQTQTSSLVSPMSTTLEDRWFPQMFLPVLPQTDDSLVRSPLCVTITIRYILP